MDLARLEEFCRIAEAGSLKKAAEELDVAPNVLSMRLAAFERSLDTVLITRNAHTFALTESGRTLLKNAPGLLQTYEALQSSLKSIRNSPYRSLRLQLCAQAMPAELGPFLDRYCRQYPALLLNLYDENACLIRDGLQSGTTDICFAVGRPDDFSDIEGRILLNTFPRLKVHVPSDHRLAGRTHISFADLNDETFILFPRMKETLTRDLQYDLLSRSGIRFRVYSEDCSPYFHDLIVPIGKAIRLWNWTDRMAPNSELITIRDQGYETCFYLLWNTKTENPAVPHFIRSYMEFRKERA